MILRQILFIPADNESGGCEASFDAQRASGSKLPPSFLL